MNWRLGLLYSCVLIAVVGSCALWGNMIYGDWTCGLPYVHCVKAKP